MRTEKYPIQNRPAQNQFPVASLFINVLSWVILAGTIVLAGTIAQAEEAPAEEARAEEAHAEEAHADKGDMATATNTLYK